MVNVIGVRFENAGKLYYFDTNGLWPVPGDFVVVETTRGVEFGEVVMPVHEMDDEKLEQPMKKVLRVGSAEDLQHHKDNKTAEKEAYSICQRKINEHKLDMKLVSVEYTFDNSKILFYFTANGRVDFRSLVKDLASVFKTRIELRQIGVRDEAKMIGGLGPCGRPICCAAFLGDFQPVSIKMAKEQNLSLNPIKISGVCGRLMCCLKYEEDTYEETRRRMPRVGREVITPDGNGTVIDLNVIKETVRVRVPKGDSSEIKDYPLEEIQRPAQHRQPEPEVMEQPDDTMPEPVVREPRVKPARRQQAAPAAPAVEEQDDEPQVQASDTPAAEPVKAEPAPAAEAAPVPKQNAWQEALERAMRAARGEDGKDAE